MADITITIQAASDATMTTDGLPSVGTNGATNLAEGDARQVYGLPNMYVQRGAGANGENDVLKWLKGPDNPRWDTILPIRMEETYSALSAGRKPPPNTTAFQLRADTVIHEFADQVAVSPMPAADIRNDIKGSGSVGTPGQLNNIVLAIGQRVETIKLSGTLVDRGPVTAANPRRQILLNIARMQHFKIGRTSSDDAWGGESSNALNPRSYPCLTLYNSLVSPGYSIPLEPSGDSRQYRGIIKDLSFRLEGGKPDIWSWNMTFAVVNNEHTSNPVGSMEWTAGINRIRLVEGNDGNPDNGSGDSSNGDEVENYVEIRVDRDLNIKDSNGDVVEYCGVPVEMKNGDIIYIAGTDSNPTVNGTWEIQGLHQNNRTFILKKPMHWTKVVDGDASSYHGEKELFLADPVVIGGVSVERFTGPLAGDGNPLFTQFAWRYRWPTGTSGGQILFTDGTDGTAIWGKRI
jgi:hypothetical protein